MSKRRHKPSATNAPVPSPTLDEMWQVKGILARLRKETVLDREQWDRYRTEQPKALAHIVDQCHKLCDYIGYKPGKEWAAIPQADQEELARALLCYRNHLQIVTGAAYNRVVGEYMDVNRIKTRARLFANFPGMDKLAIEAFSKIVEQDKTPEQVDRYFPTNPEFLSTKRLNELAATPPMTVEEESLVRSYASWRDVVNKREPVKPFAFDDAASHLVTGGHGR